MKAKNKKYRRSNDKINTKESGVYSKNYYIDSFLCYVLVKISSVS